MSFASIKFLLLSATLAYGAGAMAAGTTAIECETPRDGRRFVIQGPEVTIYKEDQFEAPGRQVASVVNVRTKLTGEGFDKILFIGGDKHTLHISKPGEFSDVEDYLVIRSSKGHEMTYPLTCTWKS
jgi:hypothetical protein